MQTTVIKWVCGLVLLTGISGFLADKAYAQWGMEYEHEISSPRNVLWIDSATALIDNRLISDHGTTGKYVSGFLPINDKLFLYISRTAYNYFNDSGILVSSTSYATAMDTGAKEIMEAYGLYVNPDCWIHVLERVNREVNARISYNRGASWHDTEFPELNWQLGLHYIFFDKHFTIRNVDSSIWIYSTFHFDTLYRSVNLGKSWEKIVLPSGLRPYFYEMMAFSSKDEGLISCLNDNGLAKTTDGGRTWSVEAVGKPIKQNRYITYARDSPNKKGFYALYGSEGCHFSTSEGQWWSVMDSLEHDYINFYHAEIGYSFYPGPNSNSNLRTFSNQLRTSLNSSISDPASIYPNPTNGILFTGMNQNAPVVIFDMMGKEVLRSETFNHDAPLDIHALIPGAYMLVLPQSQQRVRFIKY